MKLEKIALVLMGLGLMGVNGVMATSTVATPEEEAEEKVIERVVEDKDGGFSGSFSAGYLTRYVARSGYLTKNTASFELGLGYKIGEGSAHFNFFNATPFRGVNHENYAENDFTLGYTFGVNEWLDMDVAGTYNTYPNVFDDGTAMNRDYEGSVKFFLKALPLDPVVTVIYNVCTKKRILDLSLSHEIALKSKFSVVLKGSMGTVMMRRANGDQRHDGSLPSKNGYEYIIVGADLMYKINDSMSLSFGPRGSINNDGTRDGSINTGKRSCRNLWAVGSFDVAF